VVLCSEFNVIPYYKYNKPLKNKALTFIQSIIFAFKIKNLIPKPDIIKTNQLMGSWMAIICKYTLRRPLVVRTGYDIYRFSIFEKKILVKRLFYFLLTQISLLLSNIYIVTSDSDKKFLESKFITKRNNILVNHNWTESLNEVTKKDIESRYVKKILAVGRLEKQKNFEFLIKQFSKSDYELDIVGTGSEEELLSNLAEAEKVKVNFIGKLPHNELLEKYKKYRIYISSSEYEGNSKSTLEAMGAGCLVIVRSVENNSEIVENDTDGILYESESLLSLTKNNIDNIDNLFEITSSAVDRINLNNSLNNISKKEYEIYLMLTRNN